MYVQYFGQVKTAKAKAALVANGSKPCTVIYNQTQGRPNSTVLCEIAVGESDKLAWVKIALSKNWGCRVDFPAVQPAETSISHVSPHQLNFYFDLSQLIFFCTHSVVQFL